MKQQKRNKSRVNLFLDGEFAMGLPLDVAATLKIGQLLSVEEIAGLEQKDLLDKVYQAAIRLISYRPRSVAEVRRHLQRKGHDEQLIAEVIMRLQATELLDDEAFARYWVEQRETFRPRSVLMLRQELMQKGIGREVIDTVLAGLDETAAAHHAAARKALRWAHLPKPEFRIKLGGFLQRRGFHYEIINQVIEDLWKTVAGEAAADNQTDM